MNRAKPDGLMVKPVDKCRGDFYGNLSSPGCQGVEFDNSDRWRLNADGAPPTLKQLTRFIFNL